MIINIYKSTSGPYPDPLSDHFSYIRSTIFEIENIGEENIKQLNITCDGITHEIKDDVIIKYNSIVTKNHSKIKIFDSKKISNIEIIKNEVNI